MFQRFVERYQLWREAKLAECKGTNPLIWAAAVAAFGLTMDAFTLVASHTSPWSTIVAAVLLLAFLVFYLRRSPLAWWFIPAWGAFSLTQIPFIHATSKARLRVGIWSSLAFGIGIIIYGLVIRRRYLAYLEGERSRAIDANI